MDTFRSELQPWGIKVSIILPGYYKTGKRVGCLHQPAKERYPGEVEETVTKQWQELLAVQDAASEHPLPHPWGQWPFWGL